MTQADDLSPEAAQAASAASDQLRAGIVLCSLVVDSPSHRAAAAQSVIDGCTDFATRVLQIGNPLRAPLTLQRLIIQATGGDADGSHELSSAELARLIAGPVGDESRVVAVIQQAETLHADAVAALREMEPSFRVGHPRVQVLLTGGPPLLDVLAGRDASPALAPAPPPPAPIAAAAPLSVPALPVAVAPVLPPPPLPPPPATVRHTRRRAIWLVLSLIAAGATATVVLRPDLVARAGITLPVWITARLPTR